MQDSSCDVCGKNLKPNQWHDKDCQLRTYGYTDAIVDDAKELGKMGFSFLTILLPALLIFGFLFVWLSS